jgi:DNA-binding beta-propeller fold protein YncE
MRFVLAASMVAAVLVFVGSSGGCGKGLFPEVTSSGTVTPTPVANAFLYTSNHTDGTVSAFTRNTNTGALTFVAKQSAGAVNGPEGIVVSPLNDFVYVVNATDNNVYQYSVGSTGSLTSLGSIPAGVTPQMVAVDQSDTFVYVTNTGSKTVSEYLINSGKTLTLIGTLSGLFLGQPFGIVSHPSAGIIYVADRTFGLIYAFTIGGNGLLTSLGTALASNGASRGNPGLMAIAFDGTQGYLFVDDTVLGVVSVFLIQSDGSLSYSNTFVGSQSSSMLGIGAVNSGGGSAINYVLTANTNGNFVLPFQRSGATLTVQNSFTDAGGPTGLVIDPAGFFAYTANSGTGTIALIGINSSQCGSQALCVIKSFASESPANSNAGTQFVATTH